MADNDDIAVELAQLTVEDSYCSSVDKDELRRLISLQEARYLGASSEKALELAGKIDDFLKSGTKPIRAVK